MRKSLQASVVLEFIATMAINIAIVWAGISIGVSVAKSVFNGCEEIYPIEMVFSADLFCPEVDSENNKTKE